MWKKVNKEKECNNKTNESTVKEETNETKRSLVDGMLFSFPLRHVLPRECLSKKTRAISQYNLHHRLRLSFFLFLFLFFVRRKLCLFIIQKRELRRRLTSCEWEKERQRASERKRDEENRQDQKEKEKRKKKMELRGYE